ncbi:uncharacterized protein [Nicotiana sylvestris]|uniref:uncharacterized protein n=1 Tax=Nicotiana sylvestris TaxID=4096 RepID=UPI00388CDFA9
MEIGIERIIPNNVCVRAFDGVKWYTIGKIDLVLTIGPVDFEVTFQVLDMDTSYIFLLGRSWIHAAGVVPFTLHQMVKFEHENQEIVVHKEDKQSICKDPSVLCLEAREGSEHIVYQAFEIVVADQCEEGTPCPQLDLSNASIMVSSEMIKHGSNNADLNNMTCLQAIHMIIKKGLPIRHEDDDFREINRELEQFDNKPKSNLNEIEPVNLDNSKEVLMDEEDAEKTAFNTPWGTYCYRVMPFGIKNARTTYMRVMTSIFHDMMHQVPSGKLLGFIVSRRGIELDPTKIKSFQDLPPSRTKKEVMSLLGRLNYISRFITQLTTTCEPIFKLLKKDVVIKWTDECQEAFNKIKEYLSNLSVLVPPEPGRPLFLYLTVLENSLVVFSGNMMQLGRKSKAYTI